MMAYCVGCGHALANLKPDIVLAISCRCGANGPLLSDGEGKLLSLPGSLVLHALNNTLRSPRTRLPHLEYYLGFSDHKSLLKGECLAALRQAGSVSFAECTEEKCKRHYERGKHEWQETKQMMEGYKRLNEIGEV